MSKLDELDKKWLELNAELFLKWKDSLVSNHCGEPRYKNIVAHWWLEQVENEIDKARLEEREAMKKIGKKLHDKIQAELHGGYDNEEFLRGYCSCISDLLSTLNNQN